MNKRPATKRRPLINSVLAPTDFSLPSRRALAYACALLPVRGRLCLLNVQHPRSLPHGQYQNELWTRTALARHSRYLESCRRKVERLVPAAARARKLKVEILVHTGPVAPTICAAAVQQKVDVICMASHGYSGLEAALLGSVARAVLTKSECPVLVVRAGR